MKQNLGLVLAIMAGCFLGFSVSGAAIGRVVRKRRFNK